ncbi:MAG: hypothetical protein ABI165_00275, partial [Bryobacteraceae bacterium]
RASICGWSFLGLLHSSLSQNRAVRSGAGVVSKLAGHDGDAAVGVVEDIRRVDLPASESNRRQTSRK